MEKDGYEVLVFHATGTCGKTMDALIDAGFFTDVLYLTTTEWCDEIDGFFGASSIERLASERGMTAQAAAFKAISK